MVNHVRDGGLPASTRYTDDNRTRSNRIFRKQRRGHNHFNASLSRRRYVGRVKRSFRALDDKVAVGKIFFLVPAQLEGYIFIMLQFLYGCRELFCCLLVGHEYLRSALREKFRVPHTAAEKT